MLGNQQALRRPQVQHLPPKRRHRLSPLRQHPQEPRTLPYQVNNDRRINLRESCATTTMLSRLPRSPVNTYTTAGRVAVGISST